VVGIRAADDIKRRWCSGLIITIRKNGDSQRRHELVKLLEEYLIMIEASEDVNIGVGKAIGGFLVQ